MKSFTEMFFFEEITYSIMHHIYKTVLGFFILGFIVSCSNGSGNDDTQREPQGNTEEASDYKETSNGIIIELENFKASSGDSAVTKTETGIKANEKGWVSFDATFETAGRYRVEVVGSSVAKGKVWVEDYIDNKDGRTYNVTGTLVINSTESKTYKVEGSPFNAVTHQMKLHFEESIKKCISSCL